VPLRKWIRRFHPLRHCGANLHLLFFQSCGDVMKLQIRVDDKGIISDVKFKTFGCGSAIASSSYMTERVMGLSLDEAGKIKNTEIAKELCLPPVKLHCSSKFSFSWPHHHLLIILQVLAEDAIRSAIRDYRSKRANVADSQKTGFINVSQTASGDAAASSSTQ
jgi:iron-sulfur cluster assembly enzyme ISCU, mitochondrial